MKGRLIINDELVSNLTEYELTFKKTAKKEKTIKLMSELLKKLNKQFHEDNNNKYNNETKGYFWINFDDANNLVLMA